MKPLICKWSNQKNKGYITINSPLLIHIRKCLSFFDLTTLYRLGQKFVKVFWVFLEYFWHQNFLLKLPDSSSIHRFWRKKRKTNDILMSFSGNPKMGSNQGDWREETRRAYYIPISAQNEKKKFMNYELLLRAVFSCCAEIGI